ncbi:type II secretion system F family protein [Kitasatospora sp. MAP5-34]|uniref:type II secretion system F family protein n=1 Tax=Kitasatospora sp. MAP5-34 TaxID=3035102 RepID=UPI0024748A10|nr:type II secretion system F family protein [Kitasatospora sp. MAP5-34]MDH6578983.1 tight adherence protein B [Kitasatospora sp. MAP5-34]
MTNIRMLWAAAASGALGGLWMGLRRRSRLAERARKLLGGDSSAAGAGLRRQLARLAGLRAGQPTWLVPELLLVPVGIFVAQAMRSPAPLIGAVAGVVPLRRWRRHRGLVKEARHRASAVIELCEGLAAELRSGATPEQALHTVTVRPGGSLRSGLGLEPVARLAAGRYGGDIPAALRSLADLPGGRGAAAVAACWHVTVESGGGLAGGLDQVADALRAERALSEEIAGELTAPRTTIAVLAALPVVGLLLGAALGANPAQVLLHTPAGMGCLTVGALLEAAGLVWTARIIRSAAEPPSDGATAECGLSRIRPDGAGVSR